LSNALINEFVLLQNQCNSNCKSFQKAVTLHQNITAMDPPLNVDLCYTFHIQLSLMWLHLIVIFCVLLNFNMVNVQSLTQKCEKKSFNLYYIKRFI